jgi:hypothetical protein
VVETGVDEMLILMIVLTVASYAISRPIVHALGM